MGQHSVGGTTAPVISQELLLSIAEQLKLPYLQISRHAELAADSGAHSELKIIQTTADTALQLLDNYLLGARLALESHHQLSLEPVSLSSVLYDTAQQLTAMAKLYDVELTLDIAGRYGPAMANKQGLQSALVSLGCTLIEAMSSLQTADAGGRQLSLSLHRCRYGLVAGIYSKAEQLTVEALRVGRSLQGRSRQPLATLTHASGSGVFVADAILQAMNTTLKPTRYRHLYGLGTILQPTRQVQLL